MSDSTVIILVVEDDQAKQYTTGRLLRQAGFEVWAASTGAEALRLAEQRPALMILDIHLPDITGFEVCRRLKRDPATASIPVLHLSAAFTDVRDRVQGLDGGADAYLTYAADGHEILATVRALLRVRAAEEHARQLAHKWQSTFDAITDAVALVDRNRRLTRCNVAFQEIFGGTRECAGAELAATIPAPLFASFEASVTRAFEAGASQTMELPVGHRWLRCTASPVQSEADDIAYVVCLFADITARKNSEIERQRLASAVENTLDFIGVAELDGRTIFVNRAGQQMVGLSASDASRIGLLWEFFSSNDQDFLRNEVLPEVLRSGRWSGELQMNQFADGHSIPVLCDVFRVDDAVSRQPLNIATVSRDISAAKRAEQEREELLKRERAARSEAEHVSRMKDEFLATLSHELRTPLNAILGWADLLRMGQSNPADLARGLETISRNARLQSQLIDDLLDMSRIISGKVRLDIENFDLANVVDAALDTVRSTADLKSVRLTAQTKFGPEKITGDAGRIQQVIWNLLTNAIKFTPVAGEVAVEVRREANEAVIEVIDNGRGIEAEFLPYVFERFRQADASTTREYRGLGLGLAIVKQLVELHGGSVSASSAGESKGAKFTVRLPMGSRKIEHEPIVSEQRHKSDETNSAACHALNGVSVVVVDDEADARDLVCRVLASCGAEVRSAASAAEALHLIGAAASDVLISDIGMPQQDGYSLIKAVRRLPQESGGAMPAIALTAFARMEDRQKIQDAGFQLHLTKPIVPAELVKAVAEILSQPKIG